jgi:hypothetical protein
LTRSWPFSNMANQQKDFEKTERVLRHGGKNEK